MTAISIEGIERRNNENFQQDVAKLVRANNPDKFMALLFAGLILRFKSGAMSIDEWNNISTEIYHDAQVVKSLIELGYV